MHFDRATADPAYVQFYDAFCMATWKDSEHFAAWFDAHIPEIGAEIERQGTEAADAWVQLRFEQDVGFHLDSSLPNPEQESRA